MKKETELIKKLFSIKENEVLEAISEIKTNGNIALLTPLLKLIKHPQSSKIENEAKAIFLNIKDEKAVEFIVNTLKNDQYSDIRKFLVAACWQNGLDYSTYLSDFVQLFINENFEIAFDAFTVIENRSPLPDNDTVRIEIAKLKSVINKISEDKKHLLVKLVSILDK